MTGANSSDPLGMEHSWRLPGEFAARTLAIRATRAMARLGARGRAQLVVLAYQAGLARPGWSQ